MHTTLLIPLNPNRDQDALFWRYSGAARWAYNWALATSKLDYETTGKRPSAYDLIRRITQLKRTPDFSWLYEISKEVPQYAIHNLDAAFRRFLGNVKSGTKRHGYPRFKKRGGKAAFTFGDTYALRRCIRGGRILLPKIGLVRFAERHPNVPVGRPLHITIIHRHDRWWAAICFEIPDKPFVPNDKPSVGIDLGLTSFATLSTGEKIKSPTPLKFAMKRLKRLQRKVSRSQKGSRRRERKSRVLARAYARTRNIRSNFLHQLTARLAKNHDRCVIEDLNVRGMVRNRHLAQAIGDAGWGEFRRQLAYKCPRHGSVLAIADRWYPSSKRCSGCGHLLESLPLGIREWTCPACGLRHDRDENAAKNLNQLPWDTGEVKRVEIGEQAAGSRLPVPVNETRSTGKAAALTCAV